MKKEVYVTEGLLRIKEQIAEAAKKSPDTDGAGSPAAGTETVSPQEQLSPETREALRKRHEEFTRFRRDVLFKVHELLSVSSATAGAARKKAEDSSLVETQLKELLTRIEELGEPDADTSDYQIRLSVACRSLDRLRLELIPLQTPLEKEQASSSAESAPRSNFFAELDSVSFWQILRVGLYLSLPLLIALLLFGALLSVVIVMTFRIGL